MDSLRQTTFRPGRWIQKFISRVFLRVLGLIIPPVGRLLARLCRTPGLPVSHPTTPYWTIPASPISDHGSDPKVSLPDYADVVIVGSGITGTSFARALLACSAKHGKDVNVVMLEARETCSGATGRNGGHITPPLYSDYEELKREHGPEIAKQIIRFRIAHLSELLAVAAEENLLEQSQCREVETLDVYLHSGLYSTSKKKLKLYRQDLPTESAAYRIYEGKEVTDVGGAFSVPALIITQHHGFNFRIFNSRWTSKVASLRMQELFILIVSLLESYHGYWIHTRYGQCYDSIFCLFRRHSSSKGISFHLFTHTPCTAILPANDTSGSRLYTVVTPKGTFKTRHIVHATNAWASHLLPGMRGRILPARGTMVVHRPWSGLGDGTTSSINGEDSCWAGKRSFVFFPDASMPIMDYLTQQPTSSDRRLTTYPPSKGELMFGGGFYRGWAFLTELGNADDGGWDPSTGDYLKHALSKYFNIEGNGEDEFDKGEAGRQWSGILGFSVDMKPWVGRVPECVSGRLAPRRNETADNRGMSAPGEWIAAGYSGEGMVHAWLSGKALAYMVLGVSERCESELEVEHKIGDEGVSSWFPSVYRITEQRWRNTGVEDLFLNLL